MTLTELEKGKRIHMIGIGGVSMSGLAEIALNMGYKITGSDQNDSDNVQKLNCVPAWWVNTSQFFCQSALHEEAGPGFYQCL